MNLRGHRIITKTGGEGIYPAISDSSVLDFDCKTGEYCFLRPRKVER